MANSCFTVSKIRVCSFFLCIANCNFYLTIVTFILQLVIGIVTNIFMQLLLKTENIEDTFRPI